MVGRYAHPVSPAWAAVGGWRTAVYSHSLVLVMALIFWASWTAQFVADRVALNEERMRDRLDPLGAVNYLGRRTSGAGPCRTGSPSCSPSATMAVFAIYLRERGSPESKEVGAPHHVTTSDG